MALTNIIREPRRELTESGLGLLIVVAITAAMYPPGSYLGSWFGDAVGSPNGILWLWVLIGMAATFFIGWLALIIAHAVGERLCDNLAARGTELRPRKRLVGRGEWR